MKRLSRLLSWILWGAAVLIALLLAVFQRVTGPTYPARGTLTVAGQAFRYSLPRTHAGSGGLTIKIPGPNSCNAVLSWRRFPTGDPWQETVMPWTDGVLVAEIPHQPPAGKVEYRIHLLGGEEVSLSVGSSTSVIARFRNEVPAGVLIPHIVAMFAGMLVGTRALLEVLRPRGGAAARLVLVAVLLLVAGGCVLGPIVQKHAFGAFWTGWPIGTDLTDNKTLVAVLAWLPATVLAAVRRPLRWAVVGGWCVMAVVFLVPHSLRGSEIDWSQTPPPVDSRPTP